MKKGITFLFIVCISIFFSLSSASARQADLAGQHLTLTSGSEQDDLEQELEKVAATFHVEKPHGWIEAGKSICPEIGAIASKGNIWDVLLGPKGEIVSARKITFREVCVRRAEVVIPETAKAIVPDVVHAEQMTPTQSEATKTSVSLEESDRDFLAHQNIGQAAASQEVTTPSIQSDFGTSRPNLDFIFESVQAFEQNTLAEFYSEEDADDNAKLWNESPMMAKVLAWKYSPPPAGSGQDALPSFSFSEVIQDIQIEYLGSVVLIGFGASMLLIITITCLWRWIFPKGGMASTTRRKKPTKGKNDYIRLPLPLYKLNIGREGIT